MNGLLIGDGSGFVGRSDISSGSVTVQPQYQYTGFPIMPPTTVVVGGVTLVPDVDYSLSYSDNVNGGTATVVVNGKGSYVGSLSSTFQIVRSVADATVVIDPIWYEYTGSAIVPTNLRVVFYNGSTLSPGIDYTVAYSDNVNAGTATVVITGIGLYSGSKQKTFMISKKNLTSASVSLSSSEFVYDGTDKKPVPTVVIGATTLVPGTDYETSYSGEASIGQASVSVTGSGNYTGRVTVPYRIRGDLSTSFFSMSLSGGPYTYSGSPNAPVASVMLGQSPLVLSIDFTVSYSDNVNAGTGTVTATGTGDYIGTRTATFQINRKSIVGATVTIPYPSYVLLDPPISPMPTVVKDSVTLVSGTDYETSYSSNSSVTSSARVTVSGIGNYTGSAYVTFGIVAPDLSNATIALSDSDRTFTGSGIAVSAGSVVIAERTLVEGTDYSVSYSNNVNAGPSAVAVLSGIGRYSGSKSVTFSITPRDISETTVSVVGGPWAYDATPKTPSVLASYLSYSLQATDYSLGYSSNVNAGTATITMTGSGNFIGTKEVTFQIGRKSLSGCVVLLEYSKYIWTGRQVKPSVVSVTKDGLTLSEDVDFSVSYGQNLQYGVSSGSVTITGIGNFDGLETITFEIMKNDVENATLYFRNHQTEFVYNGTYVTPSFTVDGGGYILQEGTDYTVEWRNNDRAGYASVKVSGAGNYSGFTVVYFRITKLDISSLIEASMQSPDASSPAPVDESVTGRAVRWFGYDLGVPVYYKPSSGSVTPITSVSLRGISGALFSEGVDYRIDYSSNSSVGTASAAVVAIGNRYSGSFSVVFQIRERYSSISVPDPIFTVPYSTDPIPFGSFYVTGSVLDGDGNALSAMDESNPGGFPQFDPDVTAISDVEYLGDLAELSRSSVGRKQIILYPMAAVRIKYNRLGDPPSGEVGFEYVSEWVPLYKYEALLELLYHIDGFEFYGNDVAWFSESSRFLGGKIAYYTVVPESVSNLSPTDPSNVYITSYESSPHPSCYLGKALPAHYTKAYSDTSMPGPATVTITGDGVNVTGSVVKSFTVYLSTDLISCSTAGTAFSYTGSPICPCISISYDRRELVLGTDYFVNYYDNTEPGNATVVVSGPVFSGSKTFLFSIVVSPIGMFNPFVLTELVDCSAVQTVVGQEGEYANNPNVSVSIPQDSYAYDGTEHEPVPAVRYGNLTLTEWAHYYVEYSNTKNVGTATIRIVGVGGFSGVFTTTFQITEA